MPFPTVTWAVLAGLATVSGEAPARIPLIDDRNVALASPVEACFQIDLRQECVAVAAGSDLVLLPGFRSLKIEGNDYGPLATSELEVRRKTAGDQPLQVTRKATLKVRSRGKPATALSLYRLDDSDLRRPAHRIEIPKKGPVKVPAGEFLASLSKPGSAPDLHLVTLAPGARHEVTFTARPGWSVVLRVRDSAKLSPVGGAAVAFRGVPGFSLRSSSPRAARTGLHGLALLSGLTDAMMQATVEHPDYVRQEVRGLLASPGSFAYQAVDLETGGRVRATVLLENQPAAGAGCEIARYVRRPAGNRPPPEILFKGVADAGGSCVSPPLATDRYILRVSAPASGARTDREVVVAAGQETTVEVGLSPIRLHGTVRIGSNPAPGFRIDVYNDDALIPHRIAEDAVAVATTDEEGEYEATLWLAGRYSLAVTTPRGAPASGKWQQLEAPEEVVDFQYDEAGVSGVVVDEVGKPVEGAVVLLRWQGLELTETRGVLSAADGSFSLPMLAAGPVVLEAHREGYRSAEPLSLEFVAGVALGPLKLVLRKESSLRGVVTSAAGAPVPQARVASYATASEFLRRIAATTTGPDGSFEIQIPDTGAATVFVTGPGCPLAAFQVTTAEPEARLACAGAPAALGLIVKDRGGIALARANLILRKNGQVIPRDALSTHLGLLQLPAETDGAGRLVVAGLAPGDYDIFLASSTTEGLVRQGASHGYLGSFSLAPLTLTEVEVQVGFDEPAIEGRP
jgi:hypothetical protein